jgi:cation diffusion facilitator family transporter
MSLQKTATVVSSLTAFLLLVIKFVVWLMSWSIAVLSSAIDSMLDLFVSMFNFFAVKNAEKDADDQYNYGRWKVEALASLLEWLIITGSGIYIFYASVMKFINNEQVNYLWVSVAIMLVSVVVTWALVFFLEYVAKKTNNIVIKSDALHYKTDLYSNLWILIWLAVIYFTWFYQIDAILWVIIALYIIYSAWELIENWYKLLLDAAIDKKEVEQIKEIIKWQKLITDYHFLKTRQVWNIKYVEVHLVFNPEILLIDAHRVGDHVESKISQIDKDHEWKIMIHLDPYDDSDVN